MALNTVCIIGGGGFLGSSLRGFLSQKQVNTISIGRSISIEKFGNEKYYSILEYSYKQLAEILKQTSISAVIDLAYTSIPNTSYDDPVKDFSENLYNVIQHLEFVKAIKADKYIYISSGGTVYGDTGTLPVTETAANFPLSPYGITKLSCERYVYMNYRIHELPAIILRPSNIYGPGQKPFRGQGLIATVMGLALNRQTVPIFGDGSHVRDYLYIQDFNQAVLQTVRKGKIGQIFNVGSGVGITTNDLLSEINKITSIEGFPITQTHLPDRPFDVQYNVLDIAKLEKQCSWEPQTELQIGLDYTWKWIKQHLQSNPS